MTSLEEFLANASISLRRNIELSDIDPKEDHSKRVRFSQITNEQSFSLVIQHQWASTVVRFEPDLFAADVIDFLVEQTRQKTSDIAKFMEEYQGLFSHIIYTINGKSFAEGEILEQENQIVFEIEILTANSSLELAEINEKEQNVLMLALKIFSLLLPEPQFSYASPEEAPGFPEGAVSKVLVNKYERDPRNRMAAIKIHGYKCLACDFDFQDKYGSLGQEFIVVHHLTPVSKLGEGYVVNPETDLSPLCANCHAMVHRHNPPLLPGELRQIIQGREI